MISLALGVVGIAVVWFFLRPSFSKTPYDAPTSTVLPDGNVVDNPDWFGMRDCFQSAQDRAGAVGAQSYRNYTGDQNKDALENTVTHWNRFKDQYPESCWPKGAENGIH